MKIFKLTKISFAVMSLITLVSCMSITVATDIATNETKAFPSHEKNESSSPSIGGHNFDGSSGDYSNLVLDTIKRLKELSKSRLINLENLMNSVGKTNAKNVPIQPASISTANSLAAASPPEIKRNEIPLAIPLQENVLPAPPVSNELKEKVISHEELRTSKAAEVAQEPPQLEKKGIKLKGSSELRTTKYAILFVASKSIIGESGRIILNKIAKDSTAETSIYLMGHTDSYGDIRSNKILALKRAQAVKAYLIKQGVDGRQIATGAVNDGDVTDAPIEDGVITSINTESLTIRARSRRVDATVDSPKSEGEK